MMAGVQRTVEGRDLMRRWMSWLKEADEFQDQGSLGQARDALSSVHRLMA
jgi:hypothetical protein